MVELGIVLGLLGVSAGWALIVVVRNLRRLRREGVSLAEELGASLGGTARRLELKLQLDDVPVRGTLMYAAGGVMEFTLRVDARGMDRDFLAIDRARVQEILRRHSGAVGGGIVETSVRYPFAGGSLRGWIADRVWLAKVSMVLSPNELFALDPRTPAAMGALALGASIQEAVATGVTEPANDREDTTNDAPP